MANIKVTIPVTVSVKHGNITSTFIPTAGQTIFIKDASGTNIVDVVSPSPTSEVIVLGSTNTILTTDNHYLEISATGVAMWDHNAIPGGEDSSRVAYDRATNQVYGEDGFSKIWWRWDRDMITPSWTSSTWTPKV